MYDRKLLEEWISAPSKEEYAEQNGGWGEYSSSEGRAFLAKEYYAELERRINYCKGLLKNNNDAFLNYVIAKLYNNAEVSKGNELLARRYCLMAISKNNQYAEAWALLAEVYYWGGAGFYLFRSLSRAIADDGIPIVETEGIASDAIRDRESSIYLIEKAVRCMKRAIKYAPGNLEYQERLHRCYLMRNMQYSE